jgi:5-methyltetrahydropteroyltriglutamate--homocysteine methyltransferase
VVGPIERPRPVQVRDVEFLRAATDRTIKVTIPGPFTMAQQAQNDYYPDVESLAMAYAAVANAEARELFAAGADIVQFDEPYLQARPEPAKEFGVAVLNRALDGLDGTTAVHLCFGYAAIIHERPSGYSFLSELADCTCDQVSIETAQSGLDPEVLTTLKGKRVILGVLDLSDHAVESADVVAARVRRVFDYVAPEDLVLAPDCGMKYLPRASAEGKLRSMTAAAQTLRAELGA